MTIKVVLVEDHEIVRQGLINLLHGSNIEVGGDFPSATGLFQMLKTSIPDVILLDLELQGTSGFDIMNMLKKDYPAIKALVLSANDAEDYVVRSIQSGARGFLPKDCSKDELIEAINTVFAGNTYFGQNISQQVMDEFVHRMQHPDQDDLTDRELQILKGFAQGLKYQEIADSLHLSRRTIEAHRKRIFEKLNFKNNTDLIKYAIKKNIIKL